MQFSIFYFHYIFSSQFDPFICIQTIRLELRPSSFFHLLVSLSHFFSVSSISATVAFLKCNLIISFCPVKSVSLSLHKDQGKLLAWQTNSFLLCPLNPFEGYSSVTLGIVTTLCNYHHYRFPDLLITPDRNSVPISSNSLLAPPYNPWKPLTYFCVLVYSRQFMKKSEMSSFVPGLFHLL